MTGPQQPIGRRFLSRLGIGGGLLAAALIVGVGLIGLFSFAVWPGSDSHPPGGADVTLGPAPPPGDRGTSRGPLSTTRLHAGLSAPRSLAGTTGTGPTPGGSNGNPGGSAAARSRRPAKTTGSTTTTAPASPVAAGDDRVHGHGNGNGAGNGSSAGNGNGQGNANGQGGGVATAQGTSPGNGNGAGNGHGNGDGN
jgi:hypothetical protein